MNTINRLKELAEGYKENCGVFPAVKIFSEDELDEILDALPKLLVVVDAIKAQIYFHGIDSLTNGVQKAWAALDEVPG